MTDKVPVTAERNDGETVYAVSFRAAEVSPTGRSTRLEAVR
jgi:hypothetical protein